MKKQLLIACLLGAPLCVGMAQQTVWPSITIQSKPAARWWWLGSAVDETNLTRNLEAYAKAGMGALEITPIYGVQDNNANDISYLTPQWMKMLRHSEAEAHRLGMNMEMSNGTGWPFGGPMVSVEDAATKLIIEDTIFSGGKRCRIPISVSDPKQAPYASLSRLMAYSEGKCIDLTTLVDKGILSWKAPKGDWRLIAAFCGKTFQRVKRAAPGGEGFVMDHLSSRAVGNYLARFDKAFKASGTAYPSQFFNDSYEVYGADWTETMFDEFLARRGYKLEEHLPEFLSKERTDVTCRIISDYRETMADLLLENFTRQWTEWAHRNGTTTRNQAHGSPGNLIDLYATVDIPECEGFGLSDFHIKGLRRDSLTRKNDSDLSMLKYASSAAHVVGKPYTSSETFTWLTEHFRTSLSQCKPDLDLMFVSGVNHIYFHGTTYSPAEAVWPGWKFYASIDMSPTNSIWRDAPAFFNYIARCQSFLQMGTPDNDLLVYLPVYDMWGEQPGRMLSFDIHGMAERAPAFINTVNDIYRAGFDMDYISDRFIRSCSVSNGQIVTTGGTSYKALVLPSVKRLPTDVMEKLIDLAREGAKIVFLGHTPDDVPGYKDSETRCGQLKEMLDRAQKDSSLKGNLFFGTDYASTLVQTGVKPELMKSTYGLSSIRRKNADGHHYFVAALKDTDTQAWIPLTVPATSAMIYNPLTGEKGKAALRQRNGQAEVFVDIPSGGSLVIQTYISADINEPAYGYWKSTGTVHPLQDWTLTFVESTPEVKGSFPMKSLTSWTHLSAEASKTMGTARYTTTFRLTPNSAENWILDLGDVRESARVRINGQEVATLWAVPYRCLVGKYLKVGDNTVEVEVTNLPANRIAEMDRQGIAWRKFKEINLVDINYKKTGYGHWTPVESGLLGPVRLLPQHTHTLSL